jgi:DNA-binding beta-propeller fold protein YncE
MEGNLKWKTDLGDMKTIFGEGASPALYGDTLVVNWDNEGVSFITALNKNTGETLWKKDRDEPTSYATPLILDHDGLLQVIVSGQNRVRSYDLKNGKVLWECTGQTSRPTPTPIADKEKVYVMSGYRGSNLSAIRLGSSGDITDTDSIAWSYHRNTPDIPSPVLSGNRLYFFSRRNGILSCFDTKTGKAFYTEERIEGLRDIYASPVIADGKVYLVGRNGTVVVIKDSDQLEILSTNRLDEGFDASPAVVGEDIYLRGQEYLYCVSES